MPVGDVNSSKFEGNCIRPILKLISALLLKCQLTEAGRLGRGLFAKILPFSIIRKCPVEFYPSSLLKLKILPKSSTRDIK